MLRRSFALSLLGGVSVAFATKTTNPDLAKVKSVYFLPMGNGFDQYLANRITREGLYQVVTAPDLADAVFTERIGKPFERQMLELYPPEKPAAEATEGDNGSSTTQRESDASHSREPAFRGYSWSRSKGNYFLVDRESRRVIWAYYGRPSRTTSDDLYQLADKVVEALR
ncbi:MAG TPA: hypothetical protein VE621_09495, partial [Bryobacteraceae bacterium]|nr:hypothetical protein [Bryobacteraceae bacterium]